MFGLLLLPILLLLVVGDLPMLVVGDLPCQQRDFGHSSHVCVCNRSPCLSLCIYLSVKLSICLSGCNICLLFYIGFFSTYCDEYDPVVAVDGQILHYVSDRVINEDNC